MAGLHNGFNAHVADAWSSVKDIFDPTDNVPSLKSMLMTGLGSTQTVLGLTSPHNARVFDTRASATCGNTPLSCHNSTNVDNLCCFNAPGGLLLLTQFWDTHPATGPHDSWTIHGLWPDNCDGSYDANCDDRRAYKNITSIMKESGDSETLEAMQTYWKDYNGRDETFWEHEWSKHGTCISTLEPSCYTSYNPTEEVPDFFNRTVRLFNSLPTYEWLSDAGITPSTSKTYTSSEIQSALSSKHEDHDVHLGCRSGELNEIWYFFNVRGSVQTGDFIPADPDKPSHSCPSRGIKYLPKNGNTSPNPTATTTTHTSAAPTSTGPPFTGRGNLDVIPADSNGVPNGCLISGGKWYVSGTCATYTASSASCGDNTTNSDSNSSDCFTLRTSKGACNFASDSGALTCGNSVTDPAVFSQNDEAELVWQSSDSFGADAVPHGTQQGDLFASEQQREVEVRIVWRVNGGGGASGSDEGNGNGGESGADARLGMAGFLRQWVGVLGTGVLVGAF